MHRLIGFVICSLPFVVHAAPTCKAVSKAGAAAGDRRIEICVARGQFNHDTYTLTLNGSKVFQKIDDEVASFEAHSDGKKITGGCKPRHKIEELGGMKIPVEIGRTCTVAVDGQEIGSVEFLFD